MNFSGNYHFKEPIDKVWKYLNDPKILKKCIQGCEDFIEKEKNSFFLKVKVKIGPVNASFSGTLNLKDVNPPNSYIIEASGSAGQLGGANGSVQVKLTEKNNTTYLNYEADTRIHGKIAQLGSRLIDGTVKKNTTVFFKNFDSLFNDYNTADNQVLREDNKEKEIITNKKLNKKYIYIFLIIFFIIFFVFINYE